MMISRNINILKPVEYLKTTYMGDARLETGIVIHLRTDGSALGEDGKIYYTVSRDDENGDCEILGYSCDISAPIDDTIQKSF